MYSCISAPPRTAQRTFVCIAARSEQPSMQLSYLCAQRQHNIATVAWLLRALAPATQPRSELAAFRHAEMICTTDALRAQFERLYDRYGDAYATDVPDIDSLRRLLDAIGESELPEPVPTRTELYAIERELCAPAKPTNFYRLATAFVAADVRDERAELLWRWYGGRVVRMDATGCWEEWAARLSHVIVNDDDGGGFDACAFRGGHRWTQWVREGVKFVSYRWIVESHRQRRKVGVAAFVVGHVNGGDVSVG